MPGPEREGSEREGSEREGSEPGQGGFRRGLGRALAALLLVVLAVTVAWWAVSRWTADDRRLRVRGDPAITIPDTAPSGTTAGTDIPIRILTWNLAHGRGDAGPGRLQNWRGGSTRERLRRLARMADVLRRADADVVILNEVDFDADWSGGVNQAETLARAAGYPSWVEQRNFDVQLPFKKYAFGNAVLSRLPVEGARWVELPVRSAAEELAVGAKAAVLVRVRSAAGPLGVIPVHLDPRGEPVRLDAVRVLEELRTRTRLPLVAAGDFNTAPPGHPGTPPSTAVGRLLELGWSSPRARAEHSSAQPTFPTRSPDRAIDWILVEPPLRVLEASVLTEAAELSDHLPVVASVQLPRFGR